MFCSCVRTCTCENKLFVEKMDADLENRSSFKLSKWYMDGVDETGNVLVGYAARLHWLKMHLNYSGLLILKNDDISNTHSFQSNGTPEFRKDETIWDSTPLQLKGVWQSLDAPIESKLIESESGNLFWQCCQPKANVRVSVKGRRLMRSGLGYVEKLEMTLKPWNLPFNELRWGRYLSDKDTVVWIWWNGGSYQNLCMFNGRKLEHAKIGDQSILLSEDLGEIVFEEQVTLRKGHSLSGIIAGMPRLKEHLPGRITNLFECKWRSKGSRILDKKVVSTGWTIHEVVRW